MDTDHARKLLARERARVERALEPRSLGEGDADPYPLEAPEGSTDLIQPEIDAGLAEQLREELAAIERAEQRLAHGTYGLSVESGEAIPPARLEAIPWAERTVEEQSRLEQLG